MWGCAVDVEGALSQGQMRKVEAKGVHLEGGLGDTMRVLDHIDDSIRQAERAGFRGRRAAGEVTCLVDAGVPAAETIGYETLVAEVVRDRPAVGMYQHNVDRFDPHTMSLVHAVHPYSFFWGKPSRGPFISLR